MIAEGTYRARAVAAALGYSSTGKKQVEIQFELVVDRVRQRRSWFGYFNTRENAERALKAMAACGWDGENEASMLRREVQVVVRHEDYQGRTQDRIAFINGDNDDRPLATRKQLEGAEKRDFLKKIGAFAEMKGIAVNASAEEGDGGGDAEEGVF